MSTFWGKDHYYEIAQLTHAKETKQKAAFLYQTLYESTPKAIYKKRYHLLTGKMLPDAPPLPPPPQFVEPERLKLEDLLKRVGIDYQLSE